MGGGGVLERGAEKEVKKEKKKAGFGEYPPRERCDLYEPIKCECVGLTVVLCSVKGKCPFYKTGEQARKDRLDSIRKRRRKGLLISDAEARMLLDAEKMPSAVIFQRIAAIRKKSITTVVTLEARPSMPSVRFTELTQPTMTKAANTRYTIQLTVTVTLTKGM